jgi:hypothetical protein
MITEVLQWQLGRDCHFSFSYTGSLPRRVSAKLGRLGSQILIKSALNGKGSWLRPRPPKPKLQE